MDTKAILRLANTIQAVKLVEHNIKKSTKKQKAKDIAKLGLENIVGSSLIKLNADFIES